MKKSRVIDKYLPILGTGENMRLKATEEVMANWFPGLADFRHLEIDYSPTETAQTAAPTKDERAGFLLDPEFCPFIEEQPFEKWACIGFSRASDTSLVLFESERDVGIYYITGHGAGSWLRANVAVEVFGDSLAKGA